MFKKALVVFLIFAGLVFSQDKNNDTAISAQEIFDHIKYLASDELGGRFTGSEGEILAGNYIKEQFESLGLLPFFGDSYFQSFPFIEDIELSGENKVTLSLGSGTFALEIEKDFVTTPFSGTSSADGELVFAGYGISAPDLKYDDYADLDVTGKIVVVLRFSPDADNPHSEFERYSALRQKASLAKEKGAAGIIFVNGHKPLNEDDKLVDFRYDRAPGLTGFPAVHIKRTFIDKMFESENLDFASEQVKIDTSKSPSSFIFKNVAVSFSAGVKEVEKTGRNVAGFLPGNDPEQKDRYIVIGAHYDHLGLGKHGSLYRGKEAMIHNGADDNASGTTGVLEIAEKFAAIKDKIKKNILFIAFSGEELGLLGSAYVVANSPIPLKNIDAMLNMDMIGRLADSSLTVFGVGSSPVWEKLLNEKNAGFDFKLSLQKEGFSPSDNSSYYGKEIPVLFFFTGTHSDYHRPSDDVELINTEGEAMILNYVSSVVEAIDEINDKPEYVLVKSENTGRMGGWKVYVGTIPDYGYSGEGFKISGVSEGGPAQKAGMKGGDIMLRFGEKKINNIYDFVYALQEHVPGDKVAVTVKRGEEELTFNLVMGVK